MCEEKQLPELSKEAQSVLETVKKLTVLDLANLVKHLEKEFGVSAAAPVAVAAVAGNAPAADAEPVEKTEFTVKLVSPGAGKINVIKVIKEITGLGLKESKDLVDAAPKNVKEKASKDDAESIKAKLVEAGATVEIE